MRKASDIDQVIAEIAAEPDARKRFPLLSQQSDWPPRTRNASGILSSPVRNEERRYWDEVHRRVDDQAGTRTDPTRDENNHEQSPAREDWPAQDESISIDNALKELMTKRHDATLLDGEARRAAFAANAAIYKKLYDEVNNRMIQAGIISRASRGEWELISAAYRDPGFDEMLAEARAIEAKRNERAPVLKASPAAIARVAELERQEAERTSIAFTPRRGTTPIHIEQQPTPISRPAPPPPRRSPGLEQAQTRMLQENLAERPDEPVAVTPPGPAELDQAPNPYGVQRPEALRGPIAAETPTRDTGNSYGIKAEFLTPKPSDDHEDPKLIRERFWER